MIDKILALAIRESVYGFLDAWERWMTRQGWWRKERTAELRKQAKHK